MQNTMQTQDAKPEASKSITVKRHSLSGQKPAAKRDLLLALKQDELMLHIHQLGLEAYKPAMDALKLYLEVYGSGSPNLYMTKNKQIAAACQMSGINDPSATRKQRLCALTCYELIYEAVMNALQMGLEKEDAKKMLNDAIDRAAKFFGLGNKKTVAKRAKAKKQ